MERRRKHRAGATGHSCAARVPDLGTAWHGSDWAAVRWFLWTEGRCTELAFSIQLGNVPGGVPRIGTGKSNRDSNYWRGDRNGQLLVDRWVNCADTWGRSLSCRQEPHEYGELRSQAGHIRRELS